MHAIIIKRLKNKNKNKNKIIKINKLINKIKK